MHRVKQRSTQTSEMDLYKQKLIIPTSYATVQKSTPQLRLFMNAFLKTLNDSPLAIPWDSITEVYFFALRRTYTLSGCRGWLKRIQHDHIQIKKSMCTCIVSVRIDINRFINASLHPWAEEQTDAKARVHSSMTLATLHKIAVRSMVMNSGSLKGLVVIRKWGKPSDTLHLPSALKR